MTDLPKNLKFTQTHEWLNPEQEEMSIGITAHAEQLLGDMVFVDLPQVGDTVSAGDELGVVESVKAAADFYAPISGVVVAVNQQVSQEPALVNQDPYGTGWLVKIKATEPQELEALLDAQQYEEMTSGTH